MAIHPSRPVTCVSHDVALSEAKIQGADLLQDRTHHTLYGMFMRHLRLHHVPMRDVARSVAQATTKRQHTTQREVPSDPGCAVVVGQSAI